MMMELQSQHEHTYNEMQAAQQHFRDKMTQQYRLDLEKFRVCLSLRPLLFH